MGKLAEIAGDYLKKGSQAYFEGKIQTRKWQDQNGQDRYTTEIVANQMQMLGSRGESEGQGNPGSQASGGGRRQTPQPDSQQSGFDDDEFQDIPF